MRRGTISRRPRPAEVVERVSAWTRAGIDAIAALCPDELERDTLTLIAQEVLPQLAGAMPST